ncbi:3-oxosteroid 1-dehydrogenase [Sodalis praecaptivus]|nr:3-oxosteroid 1-dehydrogenase [Sodalis praecaptivus]
MMNDRVDNAAPQADEIQSCDVLVVGSGGAALSAALAAAVAGLKVLIVEKAATVGGTTAMSGGAVWVPANHHALAQGGQDSPAEALTYLRASAPEGWRETEDRLWRQFVQSAPAMLEFLERHTPLRFQLTTEGDPLDGNAGGKTFGRMVTPAPQRARVLAGASLKLRRSPLPHVYTYQEVIGDDPYHFPLRVALRLSPRIIWRWLTGARTKGAALITGLLAGCLAHGCRLETAARVERLYYTPERGVTGAWFSRQGRLTQVNTTQGVVLASGGFEWDALRRSLHFPGAFDYISSSPTNEGDAHWMAEAIGARLAHMDQATITGALPARY